MKTCGKLYWYGSKLLNLHVWINETQKLAQKLIYRVSPREFKTHENKNSLGLRPAVFSSSRVWTITSQICRKFLLMKMVDEIFEVWEQIRNWLITRMECLNRVRSRSREGVSCHDTHSGSEGEILDFRMTNQINTVSTPHKTTTVEKKQWARV